MHDPKQTEAQQDETAESAGSYGQEIQDDNMGQKMGTKTPPTPRRDGSLGEDAPDATQETNPKSGANADPN